MRGAGATIAFIVTANIAILFPFKALAGGKVKLAAAIGTEQKSGKQSLPFRFYGAAFVFPQLLYAVLDMEEYRQYEKLMAMQKLMTELEKGRRSGGGAGVLLCGGCGKGTGNP